MEALQCHFTWDLDPSRAKLLCLRDELEDIGTEEEYQWLGHIYNLQGYVHYRLGLPDDAQRFFSRAAEAFRQIRNTVSDEGPWLMVNYGNLAWMHHHLGEQTESQAYLSKVDALIDEYPFPSQDELHPEICAEKAWTLMKFCADRRLLAADCFQRAISMQPDVVEWRTSYVLASYSAFNHEGKELTPDILEKMKIAKHHDPENLYLGALHLEACAKKGKHIQDEARELARRALRRPASSYTGFKPILRLYQTFVSLDEAIDLAEEVLERHPDKRHLKDCAATCYRMRIFFSDKDNPLEHSMINRAISLHKEVISLYPDTSLKREISMANIYGHLKRQGEADQIYEELLERDLDPEGKQILYNCYAKYAHFVLKQSHKSIDYHMRAAEIPSRSSYRENSLRNLEKIREKNQSPRCREIEEFLAKLQD